MWIHETIQLQISLESSILGILTRKFELLQITKLMPVHQTLRKDITYFPKMFTFSFFIPVTNVSPYKDLNSLNLLPSTILAMT